MFLKRREKGCAFPTRGDEKGTPGDRQPWNALSLGQLHLTWEHPQSRESVPVTKQMLSCIPSYIFPN